MLGRSVLYKNTYAYSKDLDKPAHSCSLYRVFVLRMKELLVLALSKDSDQAAQICKLIWVFD